jgi:hypothetical protein
VIVPTLDREEREQLERAAVALREAIASLA